jgi:hypothetical protein
MSRRNVNRKEHFEENIDGQISLSIGFFHPAKNVQDFLRFFLDCLLFAFFFVSNLALSSKWLNICVFLVFFC